MNAYLREKQIETSGVRCAGPRRMAKRKFGVLNDRRFRCRSKFDHLLSSSLLPLVSSRSNGIRTNSIQCTMWCTMSERMYMRWNNSHLSRITIARNSKWYSTIHHRSVRMQRKCSEEKDCACLDICKIIWSNEFHVMVLFDVYEVFEHCMWWESENFIVDVRLAN